jgi:hypothetical protein
MKHPTGFWKQSGPKETILAMVGFFTFLACMNIIGMAAILGLVSMQMQTGVAEAAVVPAWILFNFYQYLIVVSPIVMLLAVVYDVWANPDWWRRGIPRFMGYADPLDPHFTQEGES